MNMDTPEGLSIDDLPCDICGQPRWNCNPDSMDHQISALQLDAHHAEDDGYCSCGVLCETGTRFLQHLKAVADSGAIAREEK